MSNKNDNSDSSFKKYFESCLSAEFTSSDNPREVLNAVRNATVCLHFESNNRLNNESCLQILEHNFARYTQLVNGDCKNRYSDVMKTLTNNIDTSHCRQWKSTIRSSGIDVVKLMKERLVKIGHCSVQNETPCSSNNNNDRVIRKFLQSKSNQTNLSDVPRKKFISPINDVTVLEKTVSDSNILKSDVLKRSHSFGKHNGDNSEPNTNLINTNLRKFMPKIPRSQSFNSQCDNIPSVSKNNHNFTEYTDKTNVNFEPEVKSSNHMNRQMRQNPTNPVANMNKPDQGNPFKTARAELMIQNVKKYGTANHNYPELREPPAQKKSLGRTRPVQSKFIPPMINNDVDKNDVREDEIEDERLKHIDPKMIELIRSEIIDSSTPIGWDDIAGLEFAKNAIQEAVVWPLLRPDIFTGLRRPPRGILLFGPPGTGKTLIGKCVAAQCNATFFSISASSLTSKWIGDGEKMVRALFAVARCHQPAVVFIDEIDSLLTQRSDAEHEATRRIKTEFLVQLDGAATSDEDRLLLIGATNRPQELDEAARRRLVKRLYIPLPDLAARKQIIDRLMSTEKHSLTTQDVNKISEMTDGYSGADMRCLCGEAALGPIRSVPLSQISSIQREQVRPVNMGDFQSALVRVRPSVSGVDLEQYIKWDATYGSGNSLM